MTPRRAARTFALALMMALVAAAPATAAPRVTDVEGIQFVGSDNKANYVVLEVRTSGASQVRLKWRGQGGARQRVRAGRVGLGFARRGNRSYSVRVQACRRNRCSRPRRFSGGFRTVRISTDPLPNSTPIQTGGFDPNTGLPIPLPIDLPPLPVPVPPLPTLPTLPVP